MAAATALGHFEYVSLNILRRLCGHRVATYKTPRPMIQIREAFVRTLICTFHSIGAGRMAKNISVMMFTTGEFSMQIVSKLLTSSGLLGEYSYGVGGGTTHWSWRN